MKIIKFTSVLVFALFLMIAYNSLSGYENKENFQIDNLNETYNIEIDVDNANINIVTTSKDQIQVMYDSSTGREKNNPIFYYFDDDSFIIKQNNRNDSLVNYQANLTIYIPESISISNIDISSINTNLSIEGMTFKNVRISGDNVNVDINNSSGNDCKVYGEDINLSITNSKFDSLKNKTSTGNVLLINTIFNDQVILDFAENGNINFSKTTAPDISIDGNLKVNMTLNILLNYDLIIDDNIHNDNFIQTNTGYEYIGDVELSDTTTIDFNDSNIDKIDITLQ